MSRALRQVDFLVISNRPSDGRHGGFSGVTACVSTAKAVNTRRDKLRLNALLMQKDLRERTPNRKQVTERLLICQSGLVKRFTSPNNARFPRFDAANLQVQSVMVTSRTH
jgi:hypothetical protein